MASGQVTGTASVRGRRSAPEGEARGTARGGRYYGVAYDEARIESRWRARRAEVTRGELRLGGGRIRFAGSVSDDGVYDGSSEIEDVDLGALVPAPAPTAALGGRVSGQVLLQGTLTRPRLDGDAQLAAALPGGRGHRRARGAPDRNRRRPRHRGRPLPLRARGPGPRGIRLRGASLRGGPAARAALHQPGSVPARAQAAAAAGARDRRHGRRADRGAARAAGRGARGGDAPRDRAADGRLSRARARAGRAAARGRAGSSSGGCTSPAKGRTSPSTARPTSSATGRSRSRPAVTPTCACSRRSRGAFAAPATPGSRSRSPARRAAPVVRGTLDLEGAGLRLRGFPHGVEGLRGRVRFNERSAELEGVNGTLAGGPLTLEGQLAYAAGQLSSYDIRSTGRGLALRYPEGLRSLLDAELRLFGDAQQQWVTGTIDVRQALYTKRYDVASELLALRRALPAPVGFDDVGCAARPAGAGAGNPAHRQQPRHAAGARGPGAPGHERRAGGHGARRDRARPPLLPGPHLRDPTRRARLRQPAAARPALRHRSLHENPLLRGDAARLGHARARDPDAHLRPAAVVAADPGAARGTGGDPRSRT